MSWESRNTNGQYYTRSRRVRGRIVREYVGCGPAARLQADQDQRERERRATKAAVEEAQRLEDSVLDGQIEKACQLADVFGRAALLVAGFHFHRGEWRQRRAKIKETKASQPARPRSDGATRSH
jgi:hypothetical protein